MFPTLLYKQEALTKTTDNSEFVEVVALATLAAIRVRKTIYTQLYSSKYWTIRRVLVSNGHFTVFNVTY